MCVHIELNMHDGYMQLHSVFLAHCFGPYLYLDFNLLINKIAFV